MTNGHPYRLHIQSTAYYLVCFIFHVVGNNYWWQTYELEHSFSWARPRLKEWFCTLLISLDAPGFRVVITILSILKVWVVSIIETAQMHASHCHCCCLCNLEMFPSGIENNIHYSNSNIVTTHLDLGYCIGSFWVFTLYSICILIFRVEQLWKTEILSRWQHILWL